MKSVIGSSTHRGGGGGGAGGLSLGNLTSTFSPMLPMTSPVGGPGGMGGPLTGVHNPNMGGQPMETEQSMDMGMFQELDFINGLTNSECL